MKYNSKCLQLLKIWIFFFSIIYSLCGDLPFLNEFKNWLYFGEIEKKLKFTATSPLICFLEGTRMKTMCSTVSLMRLNYVYICLPRGGQSDPKCCRCHVKCIQYDFDGICITISHRPKSWIYAWENYFIKSFPFRSQNLNSNFVSIFFFSFHLTLIRLAFVNV